MPLYIITSPSGKQYVGITTSTLNRRMTGHRTAARLGSPYPLASAIRKYGFEKMAVETLHQTKDIEELHALEIETIARLNTQMPNGYNLTAGGEGTVGHAKSDDERAKLSARMKARWTDPEFVMTRKKNASETARRMVSDPQHCERLRARAVAYWNDPEKRKLRSEEMRSRLANDPERRERATKAMLGGAVAYWDNPAARAKQSARSKAVRASQTPERRREITQLGVAAHTKKRAEREVFLSTLPAEEATLVRAESAAKKSAETKAGIAARTPEQKAASKERYRQAALRRTPEQKEKLRQARNAAVLARKAN